MVVDDRLSALRARPDLTGDLIQRLRNGRVVGILREVRTKGGYRFYRVAVTRRTSGWVLADAVVRTGSQLDAERLLQFIGQEKDGFAKVRLASIFVTEMRRTRLAPQGYLMLARSAEAVAADLTRNALRRLPPDRRDEEYLLNDVGLDRYNRIGIKFSDEGDRLVYDGHAWRELLRRYPLSAEAEIARAHLAECDR